MPNIREYENRIPAPQASSAGANAMAELAGRTEAAYNRIGNAIGQGVAALGRGLETMFADQKNAAEQKELTTGVATFTALEDNLNAEWDAILKGSDPHDESVQGAFLDQAYERIDEAAGAFETEKGRAWAEKQKARLRHSLFSGTTADIATRAGFTSVDDLNRSVNTQAAAVFKNPAGLPDALATAEETVNDLVTSMGMKPADADKLRTSMLTQWQKALIESAISGDINIDPAMAIERIDKGDWDQYAGILGTQDQNGIAVPGLVAARAKAEQVLKLRTEAKTSMDTKAQKDAERLSAETMTKLQLETYDPATNTYVLKPETYEKVLQDPSMSDADKLKTIEWLNDRINKPAPAANTPGLEWKLLQRITKPEGDPEYLSEEELRSYVSNPSGPSITETTYNFIHGQMKGGAEQKDFMATAGTAAITAAKTQINPPTGLLNIPSPGLTRAADEMAADVRVKLMNAPDEATQRRMLTPGTKDYIFTPEYINHWKSLGVQYESDAGVGPPAGGGLFPTEPGVTPSAPPPLDDIFNGRQGALETPTSNVQLAAVQTDFRRNPEIAPVMASLQAEAPGVAAAAGNPIPAGGTVSGLAAGGHKSPTAVAKAYLGHSEEDPAQNAVLASFIKENAGINIDPAKTAWCAAWMNAVLGASGYAGSTGNRLAAKSFATYGMDVTSSPREGDIAVFTRKGGGHVGFFMGYTEDGKHIKVLGGNQNNQVSITLQPAGRLIAIRRIPGYKEPLKTEVAGL